MRITDPASDFALTLPAPTGARLCAFFPVAERDPAACEGLDVDAVMARLKPEQDPSKLALVHVRFEGWHFAIVVVKTPDPTLRKVDRDGALQIAQAMRDGTSRSLAPPATLVGDLTTGDVTLRNFGGAQVVQERIEVDPAGQEVERAISQRFTNAVLADGALYQVVFMTDAEHATTVHEYANLAMRSVSVRPAPAPPALLSRPILFFLVFWALVIAAVVYVIVRRATK